MTPHPTRPPVRARAQRRAAGPSAPAAESRLAAFGQGRAVFAVASLALVIPCLWQARLEAGDLSSHVYNAWLAQLIRQGRAPGLAIVPQSTNVLFDLLLDALFRLFGPAAAQRIAAMAAVLVFVWGAYSFAAAVSRRRPWDTLPILAVLAYGWVFRMGLFNYYLGLGLCFWALALAWDHRGARLPAAAPILLLASTANAQPVAWAVGILAYRWAAERLTPRQQGYLAAAAVLAILGLCAALAATMRTRWSFSQFLLVTGADQAYVYNDKYLLVSTGLVALWCLQLWRERSRLGAVPFQLCALTAAAVCIVPTWVWLPRYQHALVFIAERTSLALGVCLCAALAASPRPPWYRYAAAAVAALFFVFAIADEKELNSLEDRIAEVAAGIPDGQRVVTAIEAPQLRVNAVDHMIDRVCIGHCYSYANYEPASGAFRIRVTGPTPIVAPTDMDASRMQFGGYAVKPRDLPLYRIALDDRQRAVAQPLPAGSLIGASYYSGM